MTRDLRTSAGEQTAGGARPLEIQRQEPDPYALVANVPAARLAMT